MLFCKRKRQQNVRLNPFIDGANQEEIEQLLAETGLSTDGKTILYDGRTGEPFDKPATVGVQYMLINIYNKVKSDFYEL